MEYQIQDGERQGSTLFVCNGYAYVKERIREEGTAPIFVRCRFFKKAGVLCKGRARLETEANLLHETQVRHTLYTHNMYVHT